MRQQMMRVLLGVSAALLFYIGASILIDPASFAAANGITLASDPSLLSEVRAPAGLLVACALCILFGALNTRYLRLCYALSALVYGSYGLARLVGVLMDGLPSSSLTQAMMIELLMGAVCLTAVLRLAKMPATGRK